MNFHLSGRWALVCASSRGLGRACASALAAEGVNVVITARDAAVLQRTAEALRAEHPDVAVRTVVGDITTDDGRAAALAECPQVDILINNAGGPPPGDFRDWTRDHWIAAIDANMLAPIALIKATVDGMAARGFGRIVNITSGAVKAPIAGLGLSSGARSGLTGFVAGLARQPQIAGRNVTINNLLPGSFDTDRLRSATHAFAEASRQTPEQAIAERQRAIPAGRFGQPDEFGTFCAFLCSAQASYLTGQNILLDGGAYPGTF